MVVRYHTLDPNLFGIELLLVGEFYLEQYLGLVEEFSFLLILYLDFLQINA